MVRRHAGRAHCSAVVQLSESQSQAAWTPDCEKIEDMFTLYDRIHERDGQTDGRTDTRTTRNGIASRGKKNWWDILTVRYHSTINK